ncbi:MAG: hypothetical protein GX611_08515 [Clostridiales bacterium]|nr:hypothetical protein [Clostridiales bacterium]
MRKRLLCCFLIVVILSVSAVSSARIAGDANDDGTVDINDLSSVINYLVEGTSAASMENADANKTGVVDIDDLRHIVDYILNPTSVLPDSPFDLSQASRVVAYRMNSVEALEDAYLLKIQLRDNKYKTVVSPAAVDVEIVNAPGTTVYKKTHIITSSDFTMETYATALIYIPFGSITPANPSDGINFARGRLDYQAYYPGVFSLEKKELYLAKDLPYHSLADSTSVIIPETPVEVSKYWIIAGEKKRVTGANVSKITHEVSEFWDNIRVKINIKISGTKTFDHNGEEMNSACYISYKLYKDGAVINSGSFLTPALQVGESFIDVETTIVVDEPGVYTLELIDNVS